MKPLDTWGLERVVRLLAEGRSWTEGVRLWVEVTDNGWRLRGDRDERHAAVELDSRRLRALEACGSKDGMIDLLEDAIRVVCYRLRESRPAGRWRLFGRPYPLHRMAARGMR